MSIAQVDHVVLSVVLARRTMDIDGITMVQSPHFLEILNVLIPTLTSTVLSDPVLCSGRLGLLVTRLPTADNFEKLCVGGISFE